MNLLSKLQAIENKPRTAAKPPPAPVRRECLERTVTRPPEDFPGALDLRRDALALMTGEPLPEPLDPRRILYLDTETTGLGGGAGTVAFGIGLGWLTDGGFVIRQLVMRDYPEEKHQLQRLAAIAADFDLLCTFNGKSFDIPLLQDRFRMNRLDPDCLDLPHIDLLHLSRRVWKLRLGRCNLARLEEAVLGTPRTDDLPGSEAPRRFFDYLRTGEFALLEDVLRHNAQDIASLCVLLTRMTAAYGAPETVAFGEDLFSMGAALEKERHPDEARRCWRLCRSGRMAAEAQLRLARSEKRSGDPAEALRIWQAMIAARRGGTRPYVELAKHYEHRCGDPATALHYTERALALLSERTLLPGDAAEREALEYRYARLRKKRAAKETQT